jgi:23S rRNA (adenine2030-N6)-methyltransferase
LRVNYRHAYHAGNFADVVKHLALTAILLHLQKKDTPFAVIDSHAGRGTYDLSSVEARKTGEAANGIEKLRGLKGEGALGRYLALAQQTPDHYPGSPLIAARLLRPQDRLVAIEKHPDEFASLKQVLKPFRKARAEEGDGYEKLIALLPPPERRGLVLIDPPFEAQSEFAAVAQGVAQALRRFATGIYLIWFPVKSQSDASRFCGEILATGVAKALRIDLSIDGTEGKLSRAALLVLNPPFGFDTAMDEMLGEIAPRLSGRARLEWLAGGD